MTIGRLGAMMLVLAGCTPAPPVRSAVEPADGQSAQVRDFLNIVPLIVDATAPSLRSGVPLLLDLHSFVVAGNAVSGQRIGPEVVARVINREFSDMQPGAAIVRESEYRYEIRDGGRHVRLDRFFRSGNGYQAVVTQLYTDERGQSAAIGMRQMALDFEMVSGTWRLQSLRLLGTS